MDWNVADWFIIYSIQCHNKLSVEEKNKFHKLLLEDEKIKEETVIKQVGYKERERHANYKISRLLKGYARHRMKECYQNPRQAPFTYGLYALDMCLTDENKEEIKQILLDFKQLSKDKNLSFDEFLSENRPLSAVIKEVLKI